MKLFLVTVFSFISLDAFSASCCVGNASLPSLITLDSTMQVNTTFSQAQTVGSSDENGNAIFRDKNNKEILRTFKIDGLYRFKRHQGGFSAGESWKSRQIQNEKESNSGLTDFSLLYNYALKDTQSLYSHIPKIWFFSKFLIPVSPSSYDASTRLGASARGLGQHQFTTGLIGVKNYLSFDWTLGSEVHQNFSKTFTGGAEETSVRSSMGGSVSTGLGYVPRHTKQRISTMIIGRAESAKRIKKETDHQWSSTSRSSSVDSIIGWSYDFSAYETFAISYIDQTLLGPATNTQLSRIWAFQYQKRF